MNTAALAPNSERPYQDGSYLEQNPDWHAYRSPWKVQQILKMLRRHQIAPASVVEIGSGAGEVLGQLQSNLNPSCELRGYEIAEHAVQLSLRRGNEKLHFFHGGVEDVPDNSCDLVLVLDVVEHVEDYRGFLRQVRNKGKFKLFHIPLDISVQSVLRPSSLRQRRTENFHLHFFTKDTALQALEETGYEVVDWFYTPGTVDFSDTWRKWLLNFFRKLCFAIRPDLTVRVLSGYQLMVLAK